MSKYYWKWELEEKGYEEEFQRSSYSDMELETSIYVEQYLSPSIHYAECGWDHCKYHILSSAYGTEEFVALYPDETDVGGKYICVTGNSLGAIAEAVWNNVFN